MKPTRQPRGCDWLVHKKRGGTRPCGWPATHRTKRTGLYLCADHAKFHPEEKEKLP